MLIIALLSLEAKTVSELEKIGRFVQVKFHPFPPLPSIKEQTAVESFSAMFRVPFDSF